MGSKREYHDSLQDRRKELSNVWYFSRRINPQIAFKQYTTPSPLALKKYTLRSPKIQELLEVISNQQNISKDIVKKQVKDILDEIAYDKNFKVIRSLGIFVTKICLKTCSGLLTNKDGISSLKARMGDCPVIFVPSHRSYADFILFSYLCFVYDIQIPAIAAGMDFHGMWGMGTVLRKTGAFFMRRSYNNDDLYWTTFKEYIYQMVTNGELPIEFFIEGTRSRTGKSLTPKYGLLMMILKAFFLSQVSDILFVPVNITYDRVLEESLFAYELLGIPKPKESTSGFFKSLKILKENFGNIYFHFSAPISAREFFGDIKKSHSLTPIHHQEMTANEKTLLPSLAYEIVKQQQNHCVLRAFNLICILLNNHLMNKKKLSVNMLKEQILWLKNILESLGGVVDIKNLNLNMQEAFIVHANLIKIQNNQIKLVINNIVLEKNNLTKLKAQKLSEKTLTHSVPYVMLQIYINPVMHYLVDMACLSLILKNQILSRDDLFKEYSFIRALFSVEFVTYSEWELKDFETALNNSLKLQTIKETYSNYSINSNELNEILLSCMEPFILAYFVIISLLLELGNICDEKTILTKAQQLLEIELNLNSTLVHPYALSLDTLSNCLKSLSSQNVLKKFRRDNTMYYEINKDGVRNVKEKFIRFVPKNYEQIEISKIGPDQFLNKL